MQSLEISKRVNATRHEARKCRQRGNVPGVLYGREIQNFLFEISELELNSVIAKEGEHGLVDVNADGKEYTALIKEVQKDPVSRKIIHIDLEEVKEDQMVTSSVPLRFIGEELLSREGSILQKEKDSIKIKCEPAELPKVFDLDVSNSKVGDVYRLSDLEVGGEITILDDLETVLAAVGFEQKMPENVDAEGTAEENTK